MQLPFLGFGLFMLTPGFIPLLDLFEDLFITLCQQVGSTTAESLVVILRHPDR